MIWAIRLLAAAGAVFMGFLCLACVGLAGWSLEPASRGDRLVSALPALGLALAFGLLTVSMVLIVIGSRRYVWLAVGAIPALIQAVLILS